MPTTVTLTIKDEAGNVSNQNHKIEEMDLIQYVKTMKVINSIIKELQEDKSLSGFLSNIFGDSFDSKEADTEDILRKKDTEFIVQAVNSFQTLLVTMPEKAFELISVLSGIELEVLNKQKITDLMDIYDAIIEENDIEKLVTRLKKSLNLTAKKMRFKELISKATQKMKQS